MRRLLPVAVLFAVLLGLVVAKEIGRARLDDGAGGDGAVVALAASKFDAKDVARVEVTAPGATAPAYAIERRDGDRWIYSAPFPAPAHVNRLEDLCDALATGDAEIRAESADALRDFDLVPERATRVRATDAQGRVLAHLAVGRSTGASGAFVRSLAGEGDVRALVSTQDLRRLLGLGRTGAGDAAPEEPKASWFRELEFPAVELGQPTRMEITTPGRRVVFEKKDGAWTAAEGGPGTAVNATGIEQILRHLGPELQAQDLADPRDLAALGLADPKWTLAVTLADGKSARVVGAADPDAERYLLRLDAAQDPDVVYEVTSWDWQRVFPVGSSLFTLDPVTVPEEGFTRVVVERADGTAPKIDLVRDGSKPADDWQVRSPDWPLVPRQGSLRNLTTAVRNVRPTDWADSAEVGTAEIVVRAGGRDAEESALATFRIGGRAPGGKDRLAALPGTADRVMVLAEATVERLAPDPLTLFEPRPLHGWAEADVAAVRVETTDGSAWSPSFAVERADAGWTLVRGEDRTPATAAAVKTWVDSLLALEAGEVSKSAEPPASRITVEKKDGTRRTLDLSAEKDGSRTVSLGSLAFPARRTDLLPEAGTLVAPAAEKEKAAGDGDPDGK